MFKEDVTKNIYSYWASTIAREVRDFGKRILLRHRLRPLDELTVDEIEHLIWVLQEELKTRPKGE